LVVENACDGFGAGGGEFNLENKSLISSFI
jgi:hypothetical protein